jgi:hypothetical protein
MTLDSLCWCEERIVMVPAEMVRQGLTLPCRRERCITISEANGVRRPRRKGTARAVVAMPEMWRTL